MGALSVTTAKIATDAVTTVKILDENVTSTKIADNAVVTSKIQDEAITTNKIADGAITASKLATSIGGMSYAQLSLTSAQILQLNSTPILLIPSQGVGKTIKIVAACFEVDFNTTAYTTYTTMLLYTDTATDVNGQFAASTGLAASTTQVVNMAMQTASNSETQLISNKGVYVTVKNGNPVAGDSPVIIRCWYVVF